LRSNRSSDPLPTDFAAAFDAARDRLAPLAHRIVFFHTTQSTNDDALALASGGDAEGVVVLAGAQTAGRGRRGHAWHSPLGSGVYVSMILAPAKACVEPERATGLLTLTAGVALAEAVETITSLRPEIKWPNDLLIGGRKLAGILAESTGGHPPLVVLGYGINVRTREFPEDLAPHATSLELELVRATGRQIEPQISREISRAMTCVETIAAMARRYRDLLDGRFDAILDAWRAHSPRSVGAHVEWTTSSGTERGVTSGIDDRGALLVRVGGGTTVERIVGGDLRWR
jgi:BirA family biotin operon repressor/biotin-[acetyl-CoA-carboxylase] ligase